jgi:hypothetical protein
MRLAALLGRLNLRRKRSLIFRSNLPVTVARHLYGMENWLMPLWSCAFWPGGLLQSRLSFDR